MAPLRQYPALTWARAVTRGWRPRLTALGPSTACLMMLAFFANILRWAITPEGAATEAGADMGEGWVLMSVQYKLLEFSGDEQQDDYADSAHRDGRVGPLTSPTRAHSLPKFGRFSSRLLAGAGTAARHRGTSKDPVPSV